MAVSHGELKKMSLISLFKSIINDFGNLLNQHVELVKLEMKDDAVLSLKITALVIAAVLSIYTSFIFLGLFLLFLFQLIMPLWAAALLITILYILFAVLSVLWAVDFINKIKKGNDTIVNQTMKTMEVVKKWLQNLK